MYILMYIYKRCVMRSVLLGKHIVEFNSCGTGTIVVPPLGRGLTTVKLKSANTVTVPKILTGPLEVLSRCSQMWVGNQFQLLL